MSIIPAPPPPILHCILVNTGHLVVVLDTFFYCGGKALPSSAVPHGLSTHEASHDLSSCRAGMAAMGSSSVLLGSVQASELHREHPSWDEKDLQLHVSWKGGLYIFPDAILLVY